MPRSILFIYKLTANISFLLCKFFNALILEYSSILLRVDGYMVPVHIQAFHIQRTRALLKNSLIDLEGKRLPMDSPMLAFTRKTNPFMLHAAQAHSKGLRYFES